MAIVRAATCNTKGVSSPAILYKDGIINNNPCEEVKEVARAPVINAPCTVDIAPASDCISITFGISPKIFFLLNSDHVLACSAIEELGVIGYIAITSLAR